ncbi:MAG: GNAT family N-acetyltransferase, partial [Cyanobacteria bacterium P01_H01_bin.58]
MATALMFRSSEYVGEADLAAIAQLINTCRAADQQENRTSATKLQESFADPQFDITRDLRLWRGEKDDLMAVAELWRLLPHQEFLGVLHFDIHPQMRNTALANAVLQWAKTRLLAAGQSQSLPLVLHSWCRDAVTQRRSLLTQLGFAPERYFLQLRRSLQEAAIAVPVMPDSWQIRAVDMTQEVAAWVDMFNQTFIDHWDHHPVTVEDI